MRQKPLASGSRLLFILCFWGFLLALPRTGSTADWSWGVTSEQTLGTVVLVTAPGRQRPPGPLPVTDRLDIYACGYPGCEEGDPVTLILRAPAGQTKGRPLTTGFNQRYLALDLPPGTYRLGRLETTLDHTRGRLTFELKIHYVFNVRAGRTTYLGRLVVTPLDSDALLIWAAKKRGRIVTGETVSGPDYRQVLHLALEDHLPTDASAVMRAYPEREFFSFGAEKMVWMER